MAIHSNGIIGGFAGKVGPVVGSKWKDKEVIKARQRKNKTKKTPHPTRVAQQARFSLATNFLRSMKDLLSVTFPEYTRQLAVRNKATSVILKEAVTGEYPDLKIEYSQVKVARGGVGKVMGAEADSSEMGKIHFSWQNSTGFGSASKPDDKAVLIAYCPELDVCVFSADNYQRTSLEGVLESKFLSGKVVHTWMAYVNGAGNASSDSVYTGVLTVV